MSGQCFMLTGGWSILLLRREGWQNGNAPVLKTGGRKPLGVRVPRPPLMKRVLIWTAVLAACTGGTWSNVERPEPCPPDSTLYTYRDSTRGVTPPFLVSSTMPRGGFGRLTAQGIVGPDGRIERGSVRTFGSGYPEERVAAGDALFWSRFSPATRAGCAVRFLYRITYMAGIPQRVPDEVPDSM